MSEVKWIKLSTAMFDDEKIRLIEQMPDSDTIIVIWVKLLAQAGRTNSSGYIFLNENIPYTDEMLSTIFNRPLGTIRLALKTFQDLGMIGIDDNSFISISNWSKHQSVDRLADIKEKNRIRQAKYRDKKKLEAPKESNVTVTSRNALDIELELDIDKEKPSCRKQVYNEDSIPYKLASQLYERILQNNPNHKKPNLQNWANDIRLMMERDKRTEEQIEYLIHWVQDDSFWSTNILSTKKLREKYDQLVMRIKKDKETQSQNKPTIKAVDWENI